MAVKLDGMHAHQKKMLIFVKLSANQW